VPGFPLTGKQSNQGNISEMGKDELRHGQTLCVNVTLYIEQKEKKREAKEKNEKKKRVCS
jgi:hypothetical protein